MWNGSDHDCSIFKVLTEKCLWREMPCSLIFCSSDWLLSETFDPREKLSLRGLWDEDKTQRNSVSVLKVTSTLQLGKLKHPSYQIAWKAKRIYTPHHGEVTAYHRLIVLPDYSILCNSHQHNSSYKTSPSAFKINAKSLKGSWVENIWAVMRK